LPAGIPAQARYEALLASPEFAALAADSDRFLAAHGAALARYRRRWVADPLRQWSRMWEYPFVHGRLAGRGHRRVLDAGSGLTFFPLTLVQHGIAEHVACCDYDPMVVESAARFPEAERARIDYRAASLQDLPYDTSSFDALYCVSVLEHTGDYDRVLDAFDRVLAPGGRLVLTIDISLDGRSDIAPDGAQRLLASLDARFRRESGLVAGDLPAALRAADPLTTGYARTTRPSSLPWQRTLRSDLAHLVRLRLPRTEFYDLAVYCDSWVKAG
jgi:SAM-dependent methyltransferase